MACDWTVLELGEVRETAVRAANTMVARYVFVEYGDMLDEAYLALARNPERVVSYVEDGTYGFLHLWLTQRITARLKPELKERRHVTYGTYDPDDQPLPLPLFDNLEPCGFRGGSQ
jgi:hypothetical protein